MEEGYNRTDVLIKKVNECSAFLMNEACHSLSIDGLIKMKHALSDVNNTLTLLSTKAAGRLIAEATGMSEDEKQRLFDDIDSQKPNTNGFDIQIEPQKIIVEVKCNAPIRGKKLGVAQLNGILDDARKLRLEADRNRKAGDRIDDITEYLKVLAIVNFEQIEDTELTNMITKDISCRKGTNKRRKERMKVKKYLRVLTDIKELENIVDKENVYIIVLHKKDLARELCLCK